MKRPASIYATREVHMSDMSEKSGADMISRRTMLGVFGAGMVLGIGTPAAVLTATDAEAQTPGVEPRQGQGQGQRQDQPTNGTEQRQGRRTDATEQRQERRTNRTRRRMA